MNRDLHHLREDYQLNFLDISTLPNNPIELFTQWFDEANSFGVPEPNALTLATVGSDGQPSTRVVLLKSFSKSGFVFYTNFESRKGEEIANNPKVALNFLWLQQERQIRIEGIASKIPDKKSTAYYQSRPKGSQIGAWASPQSQVIKDRLILEESFEKIAKQHEGEEILPKPPHWGGYEVAPTMIEFWQGRKSRLHDRIRFSKTDADWQVDRLAP